MEPEQNNILTLIYSLIRNLFTTISSYSLSTLSVFTIPPSALLFYVFSRYQKIQSQKQVQKIEIIELKTKYEATEVNNELNQIFLFDKNGQKTYICNINAELFNNLIILISAFKISEKGLHIKDDQLKYNETELGNFKGRSLKLNLSSIEFNQETNDILINLRKLKDNNQDIKILISSILKIITHPKNIFNASSEWKFNAILKNFDKLSQNYAFFKDYSSDINTLTEMSKDNYFKSISDSYKENKNCLIFQLINSKKQFIGFYKLRFSYEWGIDFLGNKKLKDIKLKEFIEKGAVNIDSSVIKAYVESTKKVF